MQESFEDELFSIKSKFLRDIPHPKLIAKALEQVKGLKPELLKETLAPISLNDFELNQALKNYSEKILEIKLKISQAISLELLYSALSELYEWQMRLILKLTTYIPELENYHDGEIKVSEAIDAYIISRFIELNGLGENEIKTYICTTISNKLPVDFDVLTLACLRSRKISAHAGSI